MNTFEGNIFWRDDFPDGEAKGGFFWRAVDLKKFLQSVEDAEHGGEVVGFKFEDNNLEVIVKPKN